jgi:selenocysteine lyase/cysteine desulfurase
MGSKMNGQFSRRNFLRGAGAAASIGMLSYADLAFSDMAMAAGDVITSSDAASSDLAHDEVYWRSIAAQYDVTADIANLENGYWGIMARPVQAVYRQMNEMVNRDNTFYERANDSRDEDRIMVRLADFLGVMPDELMMTRGATESLQLLIGGYNKLSPGDGVLYADLDYPAMKNAMRWLQKARGVEVINIDLPEPASREGFIGAYREAFDAHPHIKLVLLTHLNNLTGTIHPIAEIAGLARERGIDIILDAAHSVGQVALEIAGLGCDFIGINLHKWVGAPIGSGLIYIRRGRVPDIDPAMDATPPSDNIHNLVHTGTSNFAGRLSIPAALEFHESIGAANKEARLRYLRTLWVDAVREVDNIEILTPDDPTMYAALTSFRIRGRVTTADNNAIAARLRDEFGILTVRRTGPAKGDCVRVTPSIYNSPDDVLKLADALRVIAG